MIRSNEYFRLTLYADDTTVAHRAVHRTHIKSFKILTTFQQRCGFKIKRQKENVENI